MVILFYEILKEFGRKLDTWAKDSRFWNRFGVTYQKTMNPFQ